MNPFLLIAASTLFIIGAMHTVLGEWRGERRLVRRILESRLFDRADPRDVASARIVRLAWHATSLTWCGIAVMLVYLASSDQTWPVVVTLRIVAMTFVCCSVLSLAIARGQHASWLLFLIVSVCAFIATLAGGSVALPPNATP